MAFVNQIQIFFGLIRLSKQSAIEPGEIARTKTQSWLKGSQGSDRCRCRRRHHAPKFQGLRAHSKLQNSPPILLLLLMTTRVVCIGLLSILLHIESRLWMWIVEFFAVYLLCMLFFGGGFPVWFATRFVSSRRIHHPPRLIWQREIALSFPFPFSTSSSSPTPHFSFCISATLNPTPDPLLPYATWYIDISKRLRRRVASFVSSCCCCCSCCCCVQFMRCCCGSTCTFRALQVRSADLPPFSPAPFIIKMKWKNNKVVPYAGLSRVRVAPTAPSCHPLLYSFSWHFTQWKCESFLTAHTQPPAPALLPFALLSIYITFSTAFFAF